MPKLKKLSIDGNTCSIFKNKQMAKSVASLTLNPCYYTKIRFVFSELQYLNCIGTAHDISKLISPQLRTLSILSSRFLDYGKIPRIPTLKKLIVDGHSVCLLDKCSENVEDLTFENDRFHFRELVLPNNLICSNLKHLLFGQNCPPDWKFIMNHKSTLETLKVTGNSIRNRELDLIAYDLVCLKILIKESSSLHTLVLPSNWKDQVREDTGKIEILFQD